MYIKKKQRLNLRQQSLCSEHTLYTGPELSTQPLVATVRTFDLMRHPHVSNVSQRSQIRNVMIWKWTKCDVMIQKCEILGTAYILGQETVEIWI